MARSCCPCFSPRPAGARTAGGGQRETRPREASGVLRGAPAPSGDGCACGLGALDSGSQVSSEGASRHLLLCPLPPAGPCEPLCAWSTSCDVILLSDLTPAVSVRIGRERWGLHEPGCSGRRSDWRERQGDRQPGQGSQTVSLRSILWPQWPSDLRQDQGHGSAHPPPPVTAQRMPFQGDEAQPIRDGHSQTAPAHLRGPESLLPSV